MADKLGVGMVKLLGKLGRTVSVIKESEPAVAYDPTTGTATPSSETFTALMTPGSEVAIWDGASAHGVRRSSGVFAADGLGFIPEIGDAVVADGNRWRITHVKELGGDTIDAYACDLLEIAEDNTEMVEPPITNLPILSVPRRAIRGTAAEPVQWSGPNGVENRYIGDGAIIIADDRFQLIFRTYVYWHVLEYVTGCGYSEVPVSGASAPYEGWSLPEELHPGMGHGGPVDDCARPIVEADPTNYGNIDTADLAYWKDTRTSSPNVERYLFIYGGTKPGAFLMHGNETQTGYVFAIQRRTQVGGGDFYGEGAFTDYEDEFLIYPLQHPEQLWAQPYLGNAVGETGKAANQWSGGIDEASIVVETDPPFESGSTIGDLIMFFEGKGIDANGARTYLLGRAVAKLEDMHAPKGELLFTWTLDPTRGYVFDPRYEGGPPEGFGTAWQTMQSHVSKGPGGVYHAVWFSHKPNANANERGITQAIAHAYSLDRGKTWIYDSRGDAIVDRDSMAASSAHWDEKAWFTSESNPEIYYHRSASQGRVGGPETQVPMVQNVWNAPFMVWDFVNRIGYVGFWAPTYEWNAVGQPGAHTELWLCQFGFDDPVPEYP